MIVRFWDYDIRGKIDIEIWKLSLLLIKKYWKLWFVEIWKMNICF